MNPKELATIGVVGGGALLVFLFTQRQTTTSYSTNPGAVQSQGNILAANSNALTTQANEQLGLAQLATSYETTHDNNQTAIAIAANNGASRAQLAAIAAASTYQSAILDTAAKIESTLSTAQTSQYGSYVTGQAALASEAGQTDRASIAAAASENLAAIASQTTQTVANTQATAQLGVAQIAGDTTTQVANIQANAATGIAGINASANETISGNAASASMNNANAAASAQKTSSMWGALGGIASTIAGFFNPGAVNVNGSLVDSSAVPTPGIALAPGIGNGVNFTNFGLPTIGGPTLSGSPAIRTMA